MQRPIWNWLVASVIAWGILGAAILTAVSLLSERGSPRSPLLCGEPSDPPERPALGNADTGGEPRLLASELVEPAVVHSSPTSPPPLAATVPDPPKTRDQISLEQHQRIFRTLRDSYPNKRLRGDAHDPDWMDFRTWASEDPVFKFCLKHRSLHRQHNPWLYIPIAATEEQVLAFRDLIRPAIVEYESVGEALRNGESELGSTDYESRWLEQRQWLGEQFSAAFESVWPRTKESDWQPTPSENVITPEEQARIAWIRNEALLEALVVIESSESLEQIKCEIRKLMQ